MMRARSFFSCSFLASPRYMNTVTKGAWPLVVSRVSTWYWMVWTPRRTSSRRRVSTSSSIFSRVGRMPRASISCSTTWWSRREVSFSMPLDTSTTGVPGSACFATCRAVARTAKDGVASTTIWQSFTQAISVVSSSSSGRATPLSMGFSRFSRSTLLSCWV